MRPSGPFGARRATMAAALAIVAALVTAATPATAATRTVHVRPDVPVTPMDQGAGPASNSPVLAADPRDSRFVVIANRLDAPDFSCALQVSGDGGRGWLSARPVLELPAGAEKCYAPEVAFDRHGLLYYLFVGLAGGGNQPMGAFLTTSRDHARTFSPPRQILGPRKFGVRMAVDPTMGASGRLHLVWLEATGDVSAGGFGPGPNPIMSTWSDDGGRTFSPPVQVSDPGRERVVAPVLALGPGHDVHVGYYDLGADFRDYQGLEGPVWEDPWAVVVATSQDGGRHYGAGAVVDAGVKAPERVMLIFTMPPPSLVAGTTRVCAAWTDARNGDADALLRCSADRARTWGQVERLNDDTLGDGLWQYLPRLAMSPSGRLDAAFYDRRDDTDNIGTEVYYTYSTDGGRHFARNRRLSSESFDSRIGQQYVGVAAQGQVEFGARLGLLAEPRRALAAWADTRNSRPGTTGQDLFAAEVDLGSGGGRGAVIAGGAVVVALVLVAGAALAVSRRRRRHGPVQVAS